MVGYDANHVTIRNARSGQFSVRTQDSIFLLLDKVVVAWGDGA
jgi:hypothetical protein